MRGSDPQLPVAFAALDFRFAGVHIHPVAGAAIAVVIGTEFGIDRVGVVGLVDKRGQGPAHAVLVCVAAVAPDRDQQGTLAGQGVLDSGAWSEFQELPNIQVHQSAHWLLVDREECEVCDPSYEDRMEAARGRFRAYRETGGEEDEFLAWLYYHDEDRELFNDWQARGQRSSYPVAGGVMFCPVPPRRRGRRAR